MKISLLDIAGLKQFISKFSALSEEDKNVWMVNYRDKGELFLDFQFSRIIDKKVYDPIHFIYRTSSVSSDNTPRIFKTDELAEIIARADDKADILEIDFEETEDKNVEKVYFSTILNDDKESLGSTVATSETIYKGYDIDNDFTEQIDSNVVSSGSGDVLYASTTGGWYLIFTIQEPRNEDEMFKVLASFVSKYVQKVSKNKEKEKVGAEARRGKMKNAETEKAETTEKKQTTKRTRRSSEEVLQEKLDKATKLLKKNGYNVVAEEVAGDNDSDELMLDSVMPEISRMLADIAKEATSGNISPAEYLGAVYKISFCVQDMVKTAADMAANTNPLSYSLNDLKKMSLEELLKLIDGG